MAAVAGDERANVVIAFRHAGELDRAYHQLPLPFPPKFCVRLEQRCVIPMIETVDGTEVEVEPQGPVIKQRDGGLQSPSAAVARDRLDRDETGGREIGEDRGDPARARNLLGGGERLDLADRRAGGRIAGVSPRVQRHQEADDAIARGRRHQLYQAHFAGVEVDESR